LHQQNDLNWYVDRRERDTFALHMVHHEYTEVFQREHNIIDYYDWIYIHRKRQFLTRCVDL